MVGRPCANSANPVSEGVTSNRPAAAARTPARRSSRESDLCTIAVAPAPRQPSSTARLRSNVWMHTRWPPSTKCSTARAQASSGGWPMARRWISRRTTAASGAASSRSSEVSKAPVNVNSGSTSGSAVRARVCG